MLSKNKIKLINSLSNKKNRDDLSLFVVEGTKSVLEIAQYYSCEILCATTVWMSQQHIKAKEIILVDEDELKKISYLKTPQKVFAVFEKKKIAYHLDDLKKSLSLVLDNIQDPGNLGTIVRIADWFGIKNIFCSHSSVDIFNPKTIQATMGAVGRVQVHYVELSSFVKEMQSKLPIYGTFLEGENIYKKELSPNGLIIMGNEGKGISAEIESFVDSKLFIPSYPMGAETSESLNVAVATAIICSEFRRTE